MFLLMLSKTKLRPTREDRRFDREILSETFTIGLPALGTTFVSCFGYIAFARMVSGMGTTIFAAHSIAITAEQIVYIPGYGLRVATSTLVGNALGEKDIRKLKANGAGIDPDHIIDYGSKWYRTLPIRISIYASVYELSQCGADRK